jgi:carboxymethylenebutenolidase
MPGAGALWQRPEHPRRDDRDPASGQAAGESCEFKVHPVTPHGFNADYRPSYRAEAAKDGWAKTLAWFKDHGVT